MKTWVWATIITLVGAAIGFTLNSNGPIGSQIWPAPDGAPEPEGTNLALLMVMGVVEALAFGLGIAFLVLAWPWVNRVAAGAKTWATAAYLGIAWVLVNWVPHTAMHINHGNINTPADYGGLVMIEYMFHFTLIIAGTLTATFFVRALRTGAFTTTPRTVPTSTTGATRA